MDRRFVDCDLTPSGMPILGDHEILLRTQSEITMVNESKSIVYYKASQICLTNYRIVLLPSFDPQTRVPVSNKGKQLYLFHIKSLEDCRNWYGTSTRIKFTFTERNNNSNYNDDNENSFWLKFHRDDKVFFMSDTERALERRSWEHVQYDIKTAARVDDTTVFGKVIGVAGLQKRSEEQRNKVDTIRSAALKDLDTLITHARDVISIVEKYNKQQKHNTNNNSDNNKAMGESESPVTNTIQGNVNVFQSGSNDNNDNSNSIQVSNMIHDIGIIAPVTKEMTGSLYHQQLSRQIADFLLIGGVNGGIIGKAGVLGLTDLYCLYNRARGTELVSPDDLYQACRYFSFMDVGLNLRQYDSGVRVVQGPTFNQNYVNEKILALASTNSINNNYNSDNSENSSGNSTHYYQGLKGVHSTDVASLLNVSPTIATELLRASVVDEVMVIDDSRSGMLYYPNLFGSFIS